MVGVGKGSLAVRGVGVGGVFTRLIYPSFLPPHQLHCFMPDYIPAVGDIDPILKVLFCFLVGTSISIVAYRSLSLIALARSPAPLLPCSLTYSLTHFLTYSPW